MPKMLFLPVFVSVSFCLFAVCNITPNGSRRISMKLSGNHLVTQFWITVCIRMLLKDWAEDLSSRSKYSKHYIYFCVITCHEYEPLKHHFFSVHWWGHSWSKLCLTEQRVPVQSCVVTFQPIIQMKGQDRPTEMKNLFQESPGPNGDPTVHVFSVRGNQSTRRTCKPLTGRWIWNLLPK